MNFGIGYGILLGVLKTLKIPHTEVRANKWRSIVMEGGRCKEKGTGSIKFPDKGSERESSKPAGRNESEPTCSLEMHNGVVDPLLQRGRLEHLS